MHKYIEDAYQGQPRHNLEATESNNTIDRVKYNVSTMIIRNEMERYHLVNEITLELGFRIYLLCYLEIQLIKYQN
jgi:hypothetical protein